MAAFAVYGISAAAAGSGPWVVGVDDLSTYTGVSYTRWQNFAGAEGRDGDVLDLPSAFTRTDLGAEVSYGVARRFEASIGASVAYAAVGRAEDGGPCEDLEDACGDVVGLAPVQVRLKALALDEVQGAPLSLSLGVGFRFGDHTRATRGRVTAIGAGQTDLSAVVSVGRAGGLAGMSYAAFLDIETRYRLGIGDVNGRKAPGDELSVRGEWLLYPKPSLSGGLVFDWLESFRGSDWGDVDFASNDRFTALRVRSFKVGGKLNVRSVDNVSFSISALGTVAARNNPADFFTVGVGIGTFRASRRSRGTP